MKNRLAQIWDFIFRNDPKLQKIPLQIMRKNVNIDSHLQRNLLNVYISNVYKKG